MRRASSFSTRLSRLFGALFVASMVSGVLTWYGGMPWIGLEGEREQRLVEATRNLESSANHELTTIQTKVAERRGDVRVVSESKTLSDGLAKGDSIALQKDFRRIFERMERAYPHVYIVLRLVDPLGAKILASSQPDEVDQSFIHDGLLQRATRPGVTELVEEIQGVHGPTLFIVRPMLLRDDEGYPVGKSSGILIASLDVSAMAEAAIDDTRVGYEQPGVTLVLGAHGDLLGRFPAGQEKPNAFWRAPGIARGFEGALQQTDGDGTVNLAVYRQFRLSGDQSWTLIHYRSQDDALLGLNARLRAMVLSGLLITAVALGLILLAARHLTQPLRRLAEAARGLGDGDLSTRADLRGRDSREICELADAFNGMADNIEQTQQTLEAKVAERTEALAIQEERLRLAVAAGRLGIYDLNVQTGTGMVNAEYASMLGYDPATFVESNLAWSERLHPDDRDRVYAAYDRYVSGASPDYVVEYRQRRASGDWVWVLSKGQIVARDAHGLPLRMMGTHADISVRKLAESRLQMAANVFTHAREGIVISDAAGCIVDVNETFTAITGYTREESLGQSPQALMASGRQSDEFYAAQSRALQAAGYWSGEVWNRRKDGELYVEMLTISVVRDTEGGVQNFVSLFSDVTALKAQQRQLEHIAHYDALTGLPNRVLLADRLQQSMVQCQRRQQFLGVAFLDLDGFKSVNDQYGHDLGDQLLIELAHRMKAALRDGDTLARFGGDEFVAVLAGLESPQDCEAVLVRLLSAAADQITLGELALKVSASVGVTIYPQDAADADVLLRHADQAMYVAKQSGKNRYHLFDVAHDAAVKTQVESLDHIRGALSRREFVLFYQPKVNMRQGLVVGAEALIRWQHPERGLLAPGAFLPVIEDHPIGVEVGEWVIATALQQMADWQATGLDIPVSVNIGARQLQQPDFYSTMGRLLAAQPALASGKLELEVLETSALEDIARVSQAMHRCRALGVRFALDDFGTGYSSLTYLKRLPAEQIKIDQSFVRDMLTDADDLAIVQGVIGLANAFRREVIAEGVESIAHGTALLSLGCELAQGYRIARPMPAADLPGWVAQWRPDPAWLA
jgi:diguanylate cyclase (GGDEF)-like protein/PAS domain S-box-containing protein